MSCRYLRTALEAIRAICKRRTESGFACTYEKRAAAPDHLHSWQSVFYAEAMSNIVIKLSTIGSPECRNNCQESSSLPIRKVVPLAFAGLRNPPSGPTRYSCQRPSPERTENRAGRSDCRSCRQPNRRMAHQPCVACCDELCLVGMDTLSFKFLGAYS